MSFDKHRFAELLDTAKGNRSINKYGSDAGVDPGYISRLLRCLIDTPPSAAVISKLAARAYHSVSAEELMAAAGYLDEGENTEVDLLDILEAKNKLLVGGKSITQDQRLNLVRALDNPKTVKSNSIPKVGQVKMGSPILSDGNYDGELEIPADIEADFALEARGDSMIGVGLLDGDWAICRSAQTAHSGDIVVARRDIAAEYSEITLKYYFQEKDGFVLRASNPSYEDIPMDDEWHIGGVLVAIIRKDPPAYRIYNSYLAARDVNKEKWDPVFEKAAQLGIKPAQVMTLLDMIYQTAKR